MSGKILNSTSPEAEILRMIEVLIRKLAAGEATPKDMQMLQDLQQTRVNLLRPKVFGRTSQWEMEEPFKAIA